MSAVQIKKQDYVSRKEITRINDYINAVKISSPIKVKDITESADVCTPGFGGPSCGAGDCDCACISISETLKSIEDCL